MEFLELIQALAQGREEELAEAMSLKADPPPAGERSRIQDADFVDPNIAQSQPQLQVPAGGTPPIASQQTQQQGPFTSPVGSGAPLPAGLPGTQSGPGVISPVAEKAGLENNLGSLLAGGVLPEAGTAGPEPGPVPARGAPPNLGAANPAQTFNAVTPTVDLQSMLSLAQLINGGQ